MVCEHIEKEKSNLWKRHSFMFESAHGHFRNKKMQVQTVHHYLDAIA